MAKIATLAVDTETTGLDLYHGALPFLVTTCTDKGYVKTWERPVDPLTRKPRFSRQDLQDIQSYINSADRLVCQNSKFDVAALTQLYSSQGMEFEWDWERTHDTLIAGHLLSSNTPHNLTDMAEEYLGLLIEPREKACKEACEKARRLTRRKGFGLENWRIAKRDDPDMPSAKDTNWKYDLWLPRAICLHADELWKQFLTTKPNGWVQPRWWDNKEGYKPTPKERKANPKPWFYDLSKEHPWRTVTRLYADADSQATILLFAKMEDELEERKLTKIYEWRRKLMKVANGMEQRGVTVIERNLSRVERDFRSSSQEAGKELVSIAADLDYDLKLPKTSNNRSLLEFCYGQDIHDEDGELIGRKEWLNLPVVKRTPKGSPSFDKGAVEVYLATLEKSSPAYKFIHTLAGKRKRDTALTFMAAYRRFWLATQCPGYYLLHPSLNPCGTNTLRWSCQSPNEQNISKKGIDATCPDCEGTGKAPGHIEDPSSQGECKRCWDKDLKESTGRVPMNVRYAFGPPPGYEWWSMDYQNLELRIPFYKSGEQALIDLFERPDDPPYFGSNHLANFHAVYPDIWKSVEDEVGYERAGPTCKKRFADTWYQWCKNGGFAKQYGGQRRKVDSTFRRDGAFDLMESKFSNLAKLNRECIKEANQKGYVETWPDSSVDPERGYPVMCEMIEGRGRKEVMPTVPLSYKVQSTAMWMTCGGMLTCQEQIDEWNNDGFDASIIIQLHDEMVFQMPAGRGPEPWKTNLPRARRLRQLMSERGKFIGIPTPVSMEWHVNNWGEGQGIK